MKYMDLTEAALNANIAYYRSLRDKYTELALNAYTEEQKCQLALKMKKNPEIALNDLLTDN